MAKILSSNIDYFEGYKLLGIASQLKDYSLVFFINQNLEFNLKKFENMNIVDNEENTAAFSWYYYNDEHIQYKIYLISNSSSSGKLFPSEKEMDYFMLLKDYPYEEDYDSRIIPEIRKIQNVLAVFNFDLNKIKNADLFIENVELHEIKHIKRPENKFKRLWEELKTNTNLITFKDYGFEN